MGHNNGISTVMDDIKAADERVRIDGVPHFVMGSFFCRIFLMF